MSGNRNSGRKRKPKADRATHAITAWMTADDKQTIERAAAIARVPVGRWLGTVGLERAMLQDVK